MMQIEIFWMLLTLFIAFVLASVVIILTIKGGKNDN